MSDMIITVNVLTEVIMSRLANIVVYEENKWILKNNGFYNEGKFIKLPHDLEKHRNVVVLSPNVIKDIVEDKDKFFTKEFKYSSKCEISVVNADSFEYPSDLVMNFANAYHPGGGYKSGACAQEECLCRQSTLYESISSPKASKMYKFNFKFGTAFDSDYMLLSPVVDVFRNIDLEFIPKPYTTAVMTIPAPNLFDRAYGQSQEALDSVMKKRLRQYLYCAARFGYRTITLGAWGCGAFGHDARNVAGYFKELIVEEKMWKLFDKIIFAVYGRGNSEYNYKMFKEVLGEGSKCSTHVDAL